MQTVLCPTRSSSALPLWGGLLWLLGGGVVKLQGLPDLPVLLVDQLQGQGAVQRLGKHVETFYQLHCSCQGGLVSMTTVSECFLLYVTSVWGRGLNMLMLLFRLFSGGFA